MNDRPSLLLTWAMSLPHETFKCDACSAQARAESLCTSPRVEAAPFDARSLPEGACSSVQARPLPGTTRSTQAHNRRQQKGARGGSQPWAAEASERRPAASLRCQPQADLGQTGVRRGRKNLRCRAAPRCALARKWSVRVRHAHLRACRPIRPGCRCAPVVRCECRQRGPEPACSPMVAPRVAAAAPLTPASWSRSFQVARARVAMTFEREGELPDAAEEAWLQKRYLQGRKAPHPPPHCSPLPSCPRRDSRRDDDIKVVLPRSCKVLLWGSRPKPEAARTPRVAGDIGAARAAGSQGPA